MKIFYPLLCYFPSESGGPANTIYWLNKELGKHGFSSYIVSTRFGQNKKEIDSKALYGNFGIKTEFISSSIFSFLTEKQIRKLKKSTVIHFSSLFFKPTLFYVILGIIWRKKMVLSPRGELYSSALNRKSLKKKIYLKVIRLFQRKIQFHSTNPVETRQIKEYFPKANSITEIANYIEIPEKHTTEIKNQILFLGRINPIKNIDLLIKAFGKLSPEITSDFKLKIAGEALLGYEQEYLKYLRSLIEDLQLENKIEFLRGVYGNPKEILLAESYCLVLPSKSENFGNVVLEALCQGTPAIVTKNAPWEIIEKKKAGYWIEPEIEIITQVLKEIIELNTTEYKHFRNNALNLATSEFDIKKNIHKWIKFYEGL